MESINQFNDGMNSDLSKFLQNKNSYLQALNFRATTELGDSNGSLVNIKGNECKVSFPTTQDIFKLKVVDVGGLNDDTVTITILGETTTSLNVTSSTTGKQIYDLIKYLPNCYESTNPTPDPTSKFGVAYGTDYVIIYQNPEYTDCGPSVNSIFPTTTVNRSGGSTKNTLMFIDSGGNPQYIQIIASYVQTNNNLYIIGSTFINNDIYLLTSDEQPGIIPPHDTFVGSSMIWKLNINDITRQTTLKLLYANYLDFTSEHPVPPSAITGRYESQNIQRIYWTDFYNKVRTVNVADPQLMALDPKLLSITPSVELSQPVLNNIISGSLPVGAYQLSYRLTKDLGAVTNYCELSNMVYLVVADINGDFQNYQGSPPGSNSGKGIQWVINNIDTTYDKIEVIVSFRDSDGAVPAIQNILTQTIPSNGTLTVNYTDDSNASYVSVTLDEFLILASTFTHAKTVDTKDNRLFWGNVKSVKKELSNWDSRAFRAKTSGADDIILVNGGVTSTYTSTSAQTLEETQDAINEYYDSSGNLSSNGCYYKPNTNILGGSGANVSYEFGTVSLLADSLFTMDSGDDWEINDNAPFRSTSTDNINVDTNGNVTINATLFDPYEYPMQGSKGTMKYPYREGLYKGYQHEEIYRFGIQFFDIDGNPFFTKWIGDIKFPGYGDDNNNPDSIASGAGVTDFRLSYKSGVSQYLQVMYIKFTIDITLISDVIGGYEIVRVPRDGNNRTIWGCGVLTPFVAFGNDSSSNDLYLPANFRSKNAYFYYGAIPPPGVGPDAYYNPFPGQGNVETLNADEYTNTEKFKSFDCFDHHSNFNRPVFSSGDKILVRAKLATENFRESGKGYRRIFSYDDHGFKYPEDGQSLFHGSNTPVAGVLTNNSPYDYYEMPFYILKYNYDSALNDDYIIDEATFTPGNVPITFGSTTLNNCGTDMNVSSGLYQHPRQGNPCIGSATTMLSLTTAMDLATTYGCVVPTDADSGTVYRVLALYFKYNNALYGGFTYADRTLNEYIPCSEYVPVVSKNNIINTNIDLITFGGDVYTTVYDHQKVIKPDGGSPQYRYFTINNLGVSIGTQVANANYSTTFFFPCTVTANAEVRDGNHINRDLNVNTYNVEDEYIYYNYHSCENDTKKYFPKPLVFNTEDEWVNRVYFSEIKFNNETQDSWSVYLTNNFYDVEGNYGGINSLITLNNQMYYLQDRAIGMLIINPVATVDGGIGTPIQLGKTSETIQKHNNIAIDVGTQHQWSVYRSQSQIMFVDARHKKLYTFNGINLNPISDRLGQRNFFIKRLHDDILINDNPIKSKGILTTYDYYHNEFIITILNDTSINTDQTEEYYTISFSEPKDRFISYYSFKPNIYINSNKYLLSNINNSGSSLKKNIYLHNYGNYGSFYGVLYPSTLKVMNNEQPLYTKIYDNLSWISDSIKDNIEWSDDRNIYPGAIINPAYPDDVNYKEDTFSKIRVYNDYQNSDWVILDPNDKYSIRRIERSWNVQVPRNKFDYDNYNPSLYSIFDPSKLTKTSFGERFRDKYLIIDLHYPNTLNNRFVIHTLKSQLRISDR